MLRLMKLLQLSVLSAFVVACGDDGPAPSAVAPECNALGGAACVMPFPSSVYEDEDGLDIPMGALPTNIDGTVADPARLNERNGWSANAELVMAFSTGV